MKITGCETQWQVGDVWSYGSGALVRVLDVGPHIGPDWYGGRGVLVEYVTDGRRVHHATLAGRWDTLISRVPVGEPVA